uniref:ATP synthase complex subunit 8 n=1 Tax=Endomychus coccineus TaxID=295833 RepID=S4SUB7_9CUCU|nr:ATP synthase F0 subunit 8 [Endomychus coccineus]
MPQMAPMNWINLFIYFVMLFIILNSINYFNYLKMPNLNSNLVSKMLKNNWKW